MTLRSGGYGQVLDFCSGALSLESPSTKTEVHHAANCFNRLGLFACAVRFRVGLGAGCTSSALQDVPSGGLALHCTGSAYYEVRDVEGSGESFQLKDCEADDIEEVTFAGTIDCSGVQGVTRSSDCIPRP